MLEEEKSEWQEQQQCVDGLSRNCNLNTNIFTMLLPKKKKKKNEVSSMVKNEQCCKTVEFSIFSICSSDYDPIVHIYIFKNNMPNEDCDYVLELWNTSHIIDILDWEND